MFSMFASLSVGYNHPYVLENKERLLASAINKPTNSDIYSKSMAEFVETMEDWFVVIKFKILVNVGSLSNGK